eukprot:2383199-Pyramimonas_sp.AAC.1
MKHSNDFRMGVLVGGRSGGRGSTANRGATAQSRTQTARNNSGAAVAAWNSFGIDPQPVRTPPRASRDTALQEALALAGKKTAG